MLPARRGSLEIFRLLLKHGANMEKANKVGETPLWIACFQRHFLVVKLLVEHGANINKRCGSFNQSVLFLASRSGDLPSMSYLVEQGADIEIADRHDCTSLHHACLCGKLEAARYLLEEGADRDKATEKGKTPLHIAAYLGYLDIANLLMVYGADLNARTNDGILPIEMGYRNTEELKQAIRDEPRLRMEDAPSKRATEQDRHPNAATSATAQQEEDGKNNKRPREDKAGSAEFEDQEKKEPSSKKPRLDESKAEEGKVEEEDEDSEPRRGRLRSE